MCGRRAEYGAPPAFLSSACCLPVAFRFAMSQRKMNVCFVPFC